MFTLSENPKNPGCRAEGGEGLFIIHHTDPQAIIEANLTEGKAGATLSANYLYENSDGMVERWNLTIKFMFKNIGDDLSDELAMQIVDQAWHWFVDYLAWEDENIDNDLI